MTSWMRIKSRMRSSRKKIRSSRSTVDALNPHNWAPFSHLETARYLLASGDLDPEVLARWKKYLAEPDKQHPFLKDWYAAKTLPISVPRLRRNFQAQVLAVIAEKARVDDEKSHPPRTQSEP